MLDRPLLVGFLARAVANNVTDLGVGKHRRIEVDGLLRPAADPAHEHQSGPDSLSDVVVAGAHHLPGETVSILGPPIAFAEGIGLLAGG
jgi:hypothetical protein